jgi:hypothetical protein
MEFELNAYTKEVEAECEKFFQKSASQNDPQAFWKLEAYPFYGVLVHLADKVIEEYKYQLEKPELKELIRQLQAIEQIHFDNIKARIDKITGN